MPKILIIGLGNCGKDKFAEYIAKHKETWSFKSSSMAACEKAVYPVLKDRYGYTSIQECFDDRRNHREEWKQLITEYNTPDKARLAKEILGTSDAYVGMRCVEEYQECKAQNLFDYILWVDASVRLPDLEDPSMSIPFNASNMLVVDNNGSLGDLEDTAIYFVQHYLEGTAG